MAPKLLFFLVLSGAPGEIRTPDLLIRSQSLYPAELRAHKSGPMRNPNAKPYTDYQGFNPGAIKPSRSGCWLLGRGDQRQLLRNLEARQPYQPCHRRGVQPGCVVLHQQCLRSAVNRDPPHSVNVACAGQGRGHSFRRRCRVAIKNIYGGHASIIAKQPSGPGPSLLGTGDVGTIQRTRRRRNPTCSMSSALPKHTAKATSASRGSAGRSSPAGQCTCSGSHRCDRSGTSPATYRY